MLNLLFPVMTFNWNIIGTIVSIAFLIIVNISTSHSQLGAEWFFDIGLIDYLSHLLKNLWLISSNISVMLIYIDSILQSRIRQLNFLPSDSCCYVFSSNEKTKKHLQTSAFFMCVQSKSGKVSVKCDCFSKYRAINQLSRFLIRQHPEVLFIPLRASPSPAWNVGLKNT